MAADKMDRDTLIEAFEYLDKLRASGITNMFGAAPYMERELGMSRHGARTILSKWMMTYSDQPASSRAEQAA